MARLSLLVLIGFWINTFSFAQQEAPTAVDEVLEQCLANADVGSCAGVWVEQCLDDALTTVDVLNCYSTELSFWEARMSDHLAELEGLYAEQDMHEDASRALAPRLVVYQARWREWRAAKCAFEYDKFRGGSIGRITLADCQLGETAQRVEKIQSLREEAGV